MSFTGEVLSIFRINETITAVQMLSDTKWLAALGSWSCNFESIKPSEYNAHPGYPDKKYKLFEHKFTVFFYTARFVPEIVDSNFDEFLESCKTKQITSLLPKTSAEAPFIKKGDLNKKGMFKCFNGMRMCTSSLPN
jgi:hypothetical protein